MSSTKEPESDSRPTEYAYSCPLCEAYSAPDSASVLAHISGKRDEVHKGHFGAVWENRIPTVEAQKDLNRLPPKNKSPSQLSESVLLPFTSRVLVLALVITQGAVIAWRSRQQQVKPNNDSV